VEVDPSTFKHGVVVEDIEHAVRNAMVCDELDDELGCIWARVAARRWSR
jgi:hypothetical protein